MPVPIKYTVIVKDDKGFYKVSRTHDPINLVKEMDVLHNVDKILFVTKGDYVFGIRKFGIKLFLQMLQDYDPFESMVYEQYPIKHGKTL